MEIDLFNLERFVRVQDIHDSYNIALAEINEKCIQSDWMCYIFPQIQGLECDCISPKYSIKSLLEAMAYLSHDTLGERLYEVINAILNSSNVEDIIEQMDVTKLHSCLTLFDIVSPDEVFDKFLDYYFNKERCQKTLKIVSSELSYYKNKDAFRRNGIYEVPRAFLEGIDGSENLTYNNCIGTLLDLLGRGETMRMLVSRHLWNKNDFSAYRISNVKHWLLGCMRSIFQTIADRTKDKVLFNELNDIYCRYEFAKDEHLLKIADALDNFWLKYSKDSRVKPIVDEYFKDSLCKR